MLPCYRCTIIFENLFCSLAQKIIPCIIFCVKVIYSHESQGHKYQFNNFSPITVFSCHMMFMVNYGILRMKDFSDVDFFGCGMLGLWDVGDMGCWGCGMFGMLDVWDVQCGMFAGMWDVGLQNALALVLGVQFIYFILKKRFCCIPNQWLMSNVF